MDWTWPTMSGHTKGACDEVVTNGSDVDTGICLYCLCSVQKTDERIDVVVAATDLGAGKEIMDKDITITSMPVSALTRDMPRKGSQVDGHTTKVPISKGELIFALEGEMN